MRGAHVLNPAVGDMRDIVKTINALPDDFGGKLSMLVNDDDPVVITRLLIILSMLGSAEDTRNACDAALHYWYSAALVEGYSEKILPLTMGALIHKIEDGSFNLVPGYDGTTLSLAFCERVEDTLVKVLESTVQGSYTVDDTEKEYFFKRVEYVPCLYFCRSLLTGRVQCVRSASSGLPPGSPMSNDAFTSTCS